MLYTNAVEEGTLELLRNISSHAGFADFYLAGGTALGLQIGHRMSIDLDFFSAHGFDENHLVSILEKDYNASIISQYENTVLTNIKGVKVDIISHQYERLSNDIIVDGMRMASKDDIAAMKLNAVVNRGSKKDFVDVCFLLRDYTMNELITFHNRKYPNQNELLVLKSLTYFADADLEPEPLMIKKCSWDEIKESVKGQVNSYINES